MNDALIRALVLLEIGQNLLIGDIPSDLEDLLSKEEHDKMTLMRSEIGKQFIEKSGLSDKTDWATLLENIRKLPQA